jgi:hypothetical protein
MPEACAATLPNWRIASGSSLTNTAVFLRVEFLISRPRPLNQIGRPHILAGKSHEGFPNPITNPAAPYSLCQQRRCSYGGVVMLG